MNEQDIQECSVCKGELDDFGNCKGCGFVCIECICKSPDNKWKTFVRRGESTAKLGE